MSCPESIDVSATRKRPPMCCLGLLMSLALTAGSATAQPATDFDAVAPLLAARCVVCHTGDAAPLGLRLDSFDAVMKGSGRGAVVKAGDPSGSELARRVRGDSQPRMPLVGDPLTAAEIERIERWIASGARPGSGAASAAAPAPRWRAPGEPPTWADVAPILTGRCAKCHSANGLMGPPPEGYRLDSWAMATATADRVRVLPGQPLASELVRRVRGTARPRMPFDGPPWLTDEQIRLVEEWVAAGARDADGKPMPVPVGARVRLRGTLTAPDEVDGARFVSEGGRRDRGAAVGASIEIRARVAPDGSLVAERMRGR
jgi:mono/diheme cytochrome c family protein